MPTLNKPSPHDRTRVLTEGEEGIGQLLSKLSERVAIGLLIAVGFVWLAVGTIYLNSLAGVELASDLGQVFGP